MSQEKVCGGDSVALRKHPVSGETAGAVVRETAGASMFTRRRPASKADLVLVATDHEAFRGAVESFGGRAVMTAESHPSGTDRIAEAVRVVGEPVDIVINVQGDEPLIPTSVIDELIDLMRSRPEIGIGDRRRPGKSGDDDGETTSRWCLTRGHFALYFSRSMIPFLRSGGVEAPVYLHWGIYAYRREVLEKFVSLPPGRLENCEKLEQLRALENGIRIYVLLSDLESIGVDTPADLAAAEKKLRETK